MQKYLDTLPAQGEVVAPLIKTHREHQTAARAAGLAPSASVEISWGLCYQRETAGGLRWLLRGRRVTQVGLLYPMRRFRAYRVDSIEFNISESQGGNLVPFRF